MEEQKQRPVARLDGMKLPAGSDLDVPSCRR